MCSYVFMHNIHALKVYTSSYMYAMNKSVVHLKGMRALLRAKQYLMVYLIHKTTYHYSLCHVCVCAVSFNNTFCHLRDLTNLHPLILFWVLYIAVCYCQLLQNSLSYSHSVAWSLGGGEFFWGSFRALWGFQYLNLIVSARSVPGSREVQVHGYVSSLRSSLCGMSTCMVLKDAWSEVLWTSL